MRRVGMSRVILSTLVALVILFTAYDSYSGVPHLINYQGKLTNKTGSPLNGTYSITFKIYDVESGGTALWTETQGSVSVQNGVFNVLLGSATPVDPSIFNGPDRWMGVKVGTDTEMIPRQKITSVGYAFVADNGVPQGAIMMWSGAINQIPAGWALCDGTNGTPDLRNRFIVGSGNTYNPGATGGEASHVLTINEMPSHTHIQNPHTHEIGVNRQSKEQADHTFYMPDNYPGPDGNVTSSSVTATNQNTGGGQPHNILPPYYALAFIMKL